MYCFSVLSTSIIFFFFFFNDTATTEIYTLSLHDALPICDGVGLVRGAAVRDRGRVQGVRGVVPGTGAPGTTPRTPCTRPRDRKSTRLNSSHLVISYAVFCLKKKKIKYETFESAKHVWSLY